MRRDVDGIALFDHFRVLVGRLIYEFVAGLSKTVLGVSRQIPGFLQTCHVSTVFRSNGQSAAVVVPCRCKTSIRTKEHDTCHICSWEWITCS